jgi:outer membrane protein, adhesin transport system
MKLSTLATAALLAAASTAAIGQAGDPLRDAVSKAVSGNPDVAARFNAFKASQEAVTVGRAGFLPRVDLTAGLGRDRDTITTRSPQSLSLNRSGLELSLSQLLWDGLGTQHEVNRLGHERMARYFELLDATETTALEAARAHYDVIRFRRLVALAEDNYVQHRYAFLQIQQRVRAGVSRGVDQEQASARLALAESNLVTEVANLHDVSSRYQRLVGELPPTSLPAASLLTAGAPANATDAAATAVRNSAAVSAAIETVRAARASVANRESAFQPRVEARVSGGGGRNFDGIQDRTRNFGAEVVANWNLYNGGADQARVRQQANVLNQAMDQRDTACRNVRQTSAIAYNDTIRLREQIAALERNTAAIEKARDAYRQQFDIGQRSLLDLLNAENEVYTARRSLSNAQHDLSIAFVRTHAALGQLTSQLGIAKNDAAAEASNWASGQDGAGRCSMELASVGGTARADLDARAQRIADSVPVPTAPPPAAPGTPAPRQ